MSEPTTYYQLKLPDARIDPTIKEYEWRIVERWVVPVVPCKHGDTGRHIIEDSVTAALMLPNPADAIAWCEGVGDNDAQ